MKNESPDQKRETRPRWRQMQHLLNNRLFKVNKLRNILVFCWTNIANDKYCSILLNTVLFKVNKLWNILAFCWTIIANDKYCFFLLNNRLFKVNKLRNILFFCWTNIANDEWQLLLFFAEQPSLQGEQIDKYFGFLLNQYCKWQMTNIVVFCWTTDSSRWSNWQTFWFSAEQILQMTDDKLCCVLPNNGFFKVKKLTN